MSSLIKVKGFRNTIHWRVTRYDEPKEIELIGTGFPAICIALSLHVEERKAGTNFRVVADLSGGLLNTRVGTLVAKVIESDVRKSVSNLASLR